MPESPAIRFRENIGEVTQLLEIHEKLTGTGRGARRDVDALNKGAVLFMCASFEAFIEDLAKCAFDHVVAKAPEAATLPASLRRSITKKLKEDPHDLRIWDLTGDGWRAVCAAYRDETIAKNIGPFNTPKFGNISTLLQSLIAFTSMEQCFTWTGMPCERAKRKLNNFVVLRGALAHGERPAPRVTKAMAAERLQFLGKLSVKFSNQVRSHCHRLTNEYPWPAVHYGNTIR